MDPKVIDTLRYVLVLGLILVAAIFGMRLINKKNAKNKLISEMRQDVSDDNFYRALREEDAKATLLRCVGRLKKAEKLGMEPNAFFDRVFEHKQSLTDDRTSDENTDDLPTKETLVRATIKSGYQHAQQLGLLEDDHSVDSLLAGEMPVVSPAPVIEHIIDPSLSPGLEKVIPNFALLPEPRKEDYVPTDIEMAATTKLLGQLTDANVIDRAAEKRIQEAMDSKRAASKAAPTAAPVPAP